MKLLAAKYRLHWGLLSLVLGAAWGLCAPAPVQASCGDYVMYHSSEGSSENPSPSPNTIPHVKPERSSPFVILNRFFSQSTHSMPVRKPCSHRAGCQSVPLSPGTVIPPAPSPGQNWLIWHAASTFTNFPQVAPHFLEQTGSEFSPYRSSIYHPPRFSQS